MTDPRAAPAAEAPRQHDLLPSAVDSTVFDEAFLRQLERLMLVTRKAVRGGMKGVRRSSKRGVSVEFADYRDYTIGDDLRTLDWNIYARLEKLFIKEATDAGFDGLKGHRSVGGLRASIYNAFPEEGVTALVQFMREFERKHG